MADAEAMGATHHAFVGDIIGYNASPCECVARVRAFCAPTVRGNHDQYCSFDQDLSDFNPLAAEAIRWTREQLSEEDASFLRSLPYVYEEDAFTLVHSSLATPEAWPYVVDEKAALESLALQQTPVCFYGHTHVPLAFVEQDGLCFGTFEQLFLEPGMRCFVNVGSVGQPRDKDPRACYAVYDTDSQTVLIQRTHYDIESVIAKIREAGLPVPLGERLRVGR